MGTLLEDGTSGHMRARLLAARGGPLPAARTRSPGGKTASIITVNGHSGNASAAIASANSTTAVGSLRVAEGQLATLSFGARPAAFDQRGRESEDRSGLETKPNVALLPVSMARKGLSALQVLLDSTNSECGSHSGEEGRNGACAERKVQGSLAGCECPLLLTACDGGFSLSRSCVQCADSESRVPLIGLFERVFFTVPARLGEVTAIAALPQIGLCGLLVPVIIGTSKGHLLVVDVCAALSTDREIAEDNAATFEVVVQKHYTSTASTEDSLRLSVQAVSVQGAAFSAKKRCRVSAVALARIGILARTVALAESTRTAITSLCVLAALGDAIAVGSDSGVTALLCPPLKWTDSFFEVTLEDIVHGVPMPVTDFDVILPDLPFSMWPEADSTVTHIAYHQLPDDESGACFWIARALSDGSVVASLFDVQLRRAGTEPRTAIDLCSSIVYRSDHVLGNGSRGALCCIDSVGPPLLPEDIPRTWCSLFLWQAANSEDSPVMLNGSIPCPNTRIVVASLFSLQHMTFRSIVLPNFFCEEGESSGAALLTAAVVRDSADEFPMGGFSYGLGLGSVVERVASSDSDGLTLPRFELVTFFALDGVPGCAYKQQHVAIEPKVLSCIETFASSGTEWLLPQHLVKSYNMCVSVGLVGMISNDVDDEVQALQMLLELVSLCLKHDALTPALCGLITESSMDNAFILDDVALRAISEWTWEHGVCEVAEILRQVYAQLGLCGATPDDEAAMGTQFDSLAPFSALIDANGADHIAIPRLGAAEAPALLQACLSRLAICHSILLSIRARDDALGRTEVLAARLSAIGETAMNLQLVIWLSQRGLVSMLGQEPDIFCSPRVSQIVAQRRAELQSRSHRLAEALPTSNSLLVDDLVRAAGGGSVEFHAQGKSADSFPQALYPLSASQLVHLVTAAMKCSTNDRVQRSVAAFAVLEYSLLDALVLRPKGTSDDALATVADFSDCFDISARDTALVHGCHIVDGQAVLGRTTAVDDHPWVTEATSYFQFAFDSVSTAGARAGTISDKSDPECVLAGSILTRSRAAARLLQLDYHECAARVLLAQKAPTSAESEAIVFLATMLSTGRLFQACSLIREFLSLHVGSCPTCGSQLCDCGGEDHMMGVDVRDSPFLSQSRQGAVFGGRTLCAYLFEHCILRHRHLAYQVLFILPLGVAIRLELERWLRLPDQDAAIREQKALVLWDWLVQQRRFADLAAVFAELRALSGDVEASYQRAKVLERFNIPLPASSDETPVSIVRSSVSVPHVHASMSSPFTSSPAFVRFQRRRASNPVFRADDRSNECVILPRRFPLFPTVNPGTPDAKSSQTTDRTPLERRPSGRQQIGGEYPKSALRRGRAPPKRLRVAFANNVDSAANSSDELAGETGSASSSFVVAENEQPRPPTEPHVAIDPHRRVRAMPEFHMHLRNRP